MKETCTGDRIKCIVDTGAGVRDKRSGRVVNQFFRNNFQKVFSGCTVHSTGKTTYSADILINRTPFSVEFVLIEGLEILKDYHAFLSWAFIDEYPLCIDNKNKAVYLKPR